MLVPIAGVPSSALEDLNPSAITLAKQERDRLLLKSKETIKTVTTADEAAIASKALKAIKGFTRGIEDARKDVKAPVVELGRRIDAVAATLTTDLELEATRLSKLIGNFQAEQNRIAEEARIAAWHEEQRIRREQEEKDRVAREAADAEEERLAKELEAAKSPEAKETAAIALETAQANHSQDDMARQTETVELVVAVRQEAVAIPEARKPVGISTRMNMKFEVKDPVALYKAYPLLVKLVPQDALIKAALKNLLPGQTLPGVQHWEEAAAIVR